MTTSYIISTNLQFGFIFSLFLVLFIPSSALNPDGTLLLSFKYAVVSDPLSVLENWNYEDDNPCTWIGITCASIGDPGKPRVVSLILPNSQLLGSVPEDLGLIDHLRSLNLSNNSLNGTLPASLFNSSDLQILSLSSNTISGELPQLITGPSLKFLNLSNNVLAGNIPQSLTSLKSLTVVSLKNNHLSGTIPNGFDFTLYLDLSSNAFSGSLPLQFGGRKINYLNLSNNKLSGAIPPEFVKDIPPKAMIDLSNNNLAGPIPQHSPLSNQKTDSFTGNADLCGSPLEKVCTVPSTLSTPPNVTTNSTPPAAIAAIPRTINSSPSNNTPGASSQATSRTQHGLNIKPTKLVAIIVGDLAGIGILAIIILYVYKWKKQKKHNAEFAISKPVPTHKDELTISKESKSQTTWSCLTKGHGEETSTTGSESEETGTSRYHNGNHQQGTTGYQNVSLQPNDRSLVMVDGETELEIETLLKASAYILGTSGSSGIVYKAVLEDMSAFAVRRIGECSVERLKEFESYVRAIAKLRHSNLVRVRGFYWGEDEKLLISDYIDNGSLATATYRRVGSSPYHIPFDIRLKIAKGVARGLTYIHEKKHVHGNIKPSNILLTPDMDPVISDFGLHWLVSGKDSYKTDDSTRHFGSKRSISRDEIQDFPVSSSSSSYATPVNGFIGCTSPYHAPESHKNLRPNPKWDVYSFGIVLLELITGKVFSDRELGQWTSGSVAEDKTRLLRMADVAIKADVARKEKAILACFKLGFSCASLVPQKRPSMKDALQVLEKMPCSAY